MTPDHDSDELARPAGRLAEVYGGVIVLAVALLLGYFGVRGALMYLGGSRAAPADPLACAIGIAAGLGGGYVGLRLVFGWHEESPLLPKFFLIAGGLGAIGGAAWFISINRSLHGSLWDVFRFGVGFGGAGVAALVLGWRRLRGRDT